MSGSAADSNAVTFGLRVGAFAVDSIACVLVVLAAGFRPGSNGYGLAVYVLFLLLELLLVAVAGQTPGMRAAGIAVVRADNGGRPRPQWVLVRTVLLAFIAPALIPDRTGRPMHDRAAGTVMVRTR